MLQREAEHEQFHALLCEQFEKYSGDALQAVRKKAWEKYLSVGLPSRRNEAYQYVPIRSLLENPFSSLSNGAKILHNLSAHICEEAHESHLVFVNGSYKPELSCSKGLPSQIIIMTLQEAMKSYSALLNNHWNRSLKDESDAFAAINAAVHSEGLFIYVPPKCRAAIPIQLLQVIDSEVGFPVIMPRVQIFVGAQAEVQFACTAAATPNSNFACNQVIEINVEEGAKVQVAQQVSCEGSHGWYFEALRGNVKRDASLQCVNLAHGDIPTRYDYNVKLLGENSEALLHGISVLTKRREVHNHILMEHHAPNCRSNQLFKSVLHDVSRSSFEGKILVQRIAQKTEAYQLNKTLLINDGAQAFSKPNLEIFADDVKASHGSTIGQLNHEHLFYLQARGFSFDYARRLLIEGFCQEVSQLACADSLANAFLKKIQNN